MTILAAALLVVGASAEAHPLSISLADGDARVAFTGEYRGRFLHNGGKDFNPGANFDAITQRFRVGLEADLWEKFRFVVQLQDVRTWGEEADPSADFAANGFDLHQGFLEIMPTPWLTLQIGRFEMKYDSQRLIGPGAWSDQSRAFDAVRARVETKHYAAHLFFSKLAEKDSTNGAKLDKDFGGLWLRATRVPFFQPTLIALVDTDYAVDRVRHTYGLYVDGVVAGFNYSTEVYYQTGKKGGTSIDAFLAAASVSYAFDLPLSPSFKVWYDYVSGDSDATDLSNGAFDTLFASNHVYYGYMDIFTNIPTHTGSLGLIDTGVGVGVRPTKGVDVKLDAHYFQLAHGDASGERELGMEVDLTVAWIRKPFMLTGGYSFFVPGNAMTNLKAGGRATEHFAYVMTGIKF